MNQAILQSSKQESEEEFHGLMQAPDMYRKGSQDRVEVARNVAEMMTNIYGNGSKQQIAAIKLVEQAEKEHEDQMKNVQLIEQEGMRQDAQAQIAIKKQQLAGEFELGNITKAQELAQLRAFEVQEYQATLSEYNNKLALLRDEPEKYAEMLNKIKALKNRSKLDIGNIDKQMQVDTVNKWKEMLSPITSAFGSAIQGFISHTMTMKQAISNIFSSLVNELINQFVKMAEQWIINLIVGKAAQSATGTAEVMGSAAVGAAAAGASVAAIPMVGWAMVPEVMAETFMAIASLAPAAAFHEGGEVSARLMVGERVLTQEQNQTFGQLSNVLNNGNQQGGGSTSHHYFHGIKEKDLYSGSQMLKVFKQLHRDGHIDAKFGK